jgi:hypothetical protein
MARWSDVRWLLMGLLLAGCGQSTPPKTTVEARTKPAGVDTPVEKPVPATDDDLQPLSIEPVNTAAAAPQAAEPEEAGRKQDSVVEALRPFNTLLGDWEGKTRKQFEGFARVDNLKWLWDFKKDRAQPSVAFHSDKSPYFQSGWITYLPEKEAFRLTTESPEKEVRVYEGTWTEMGEPKQESDGKKLQWSFKLRLTQVEPAEGEQYQVELALQENNRYHLALSKKPPRGSQFVQLDVVGTQRKNTSFAVADSDNPGPKCIVSGGLGTSSVTYQGKTYYVCCSGCAAAFEEDPERWIAKKAKQDAEKKEE